MGRTCGRSGKRKNTYRVLVGEVNYGNRFEGLRIYRGIILKWILERWDKKDWTEFIWFSLGTVTNFWVAYNGEVIWLAQETDRQTDTVLHGVG